MSEDNHPAADLSEAAATVLPYFADHLVSLGGSCVAIDEAGRDIDKEQFFAYSGFVISVDGIWYFVTAGHCIENVESKLRAKKIRLTSLVLADHFGSAPRVKQPMPFHYEAEDVLSFHRPEDGLDFALVRLRDFYRMSLEANGIRALAEEHWGTADPSAYDFFAILGLPYCLVEDHRALVPHGDGVAGIVCPTMVWVERADYSPEDIPPATFPWFVGRVKCEADLPSVEGMSGGPILGFKKGKDGLRCSLVAVQSRWEKRIRKTLGCAFPDIARYLKRRSIEEATSGTEEY